MVPCVDELMQLDCEDMSVCGNDCTMEDGDPVSEDDRLVNVCFGGDMHYCSWLWRPFRRLGFLARACLSRVKPLN